MSSGRVCECEPDDQSRQVVVDQHRPVAAVPVERHQPVGADRLLEREVGQVFVYGLPRRGGRVVHLRRYAVVDEPAEDVADPALTGLVAPQAGHDAAVDDAAHPGDVAHARSRSSRDRSTCP